MQNVTQAVYIGRFRPFHNAHFQTIATALKERTHVLILIGSCGNPRNIKNPFTFNEIKIMIQSCFSPKENQRITIMPLVDHSYDDTKWIAQVQNIVENNSYSSNITIYGNEKDHSSFYLKFFPEWNFRSVEIIDDLHSTDIRNAMFSEDYDEGKDMIIRSKVPSSVYSFLKAFRETPQYKILCEEWSFIKDYKKSWELAPYAPTFVTVDAVVECNGHILLIKRKATPGKGLWAIPGGFINQYEKIDDAVIRELKEETKIDVSKNILRGSIKSKEVFDNPYRSLRGRTITHAYHIVIHNDGYLPKVKADDDADDAQWFPINTVAQMTGSMFEDHSDIISFFTKVDKIIYV